MRISEYDRLNNMANGFSFVFFTSGEGMSHVDSMLEGCKTLKVRPRAYMGLQHGIHSRQTLFCHCIDHSILSLSSFKYIGFYDDTRTSIRKISFVGHVLKLRLLKYLEIVMGVLPCNHREHFVSTLSSLNCKNKFE